MKLYFSPGACTLASQIILRETGQKFDLVKVDLKTKESAEGDYRKVNPKGYVPALRLDNGEVLTEGAVILQWLADQAPEKKLLPKAGTWERYRALEWLNFISSELHKSFSNLFNPAIGDEMRAAVVSRIDQRLEFLNIHLKTHPYILGADFSVADAYAYNILRWTRLFKIDISKHQAVVGLIEKVESRPSVRASIEGEGLRG
jgi:glutathione S-transferase